MGHKKPSTLLLFFFITVLILPTIAAADEDPWSIANATKTTVYYTVLDKSTLGPTGTTAVTLYEDQYLSTITSYNKIPTSIRIYVPIGATARSPVAFLVNNSGWGNGGHTLANNLSSATDKANPCKFYPASHTSLYADAPFNNDDYGAGKYAAQALDAGYVVVTASMRSRNENGAHSPVTVADAKAAIRYLRYNASLGLLPAGDVGLIIISGMSGGGALSAAIGSSGNSLDFAKDLYNLGSAGVVRSGKGTTKEPYAYSYADGIGDEVFAVVTYAPITDLDQADEAYGWTYSAARIALKNLGGTGSGLSDAKIAESSLFGAMFPAYVDRLNLQYKDKEVNATFDKTTGAIGGVMKDVLADLLKASIQFRIDNPDLPYYGAKGMTEAMKLRDYASGYGIPTSALADTAWKTSWLNVATNERKTAVDTFDLSAYLYCVAAVTVLKDPPAFDGFVGRNESNLYGLPGQTRNHIHEYAFKSDSYTVGFYDSDAPNADTAWAAYVDSGDYDYIRKQGRMVDSIAYLVDKTDGDSAQHWYLRQGMLDRDTSFTTVALLYLSLLNDKTVKDVDMRYTWDRTHGWQGYHDTPDSFEWVAKVLATTR